MKWRECHISMQHVQQTYETWKPMTYCPKFDARRAVEINPRRIYIAHECLQLGLYLTVHYGEIEKLRSQHEIVI